MKTQLKKVNNKKCVYLLRIEKSKQKNIIEENIKCGARKKKFLNGFRV
jgi:hypothetical protein